MIGPDGLCTCPVLRWFGTRASATNERQTRGIACAARTLVMKSSTPALTHSYTVPRCSFELIITTGTWKSSGSART